MNEYNQLFHHCVRVLNEYDENVSEDIFLDDYFRMNKVSNPGFVSTVLIDSIRYATFLKIVIESFYRTFGINVRRSEENVYKVIIYLAFFQLDTVGVRFFRGFIYSYQLYQMHQLLEFLIDDKSLLTVKKQCRKIYDEDYIDEKLIGVIQSHLPDIRSILIDIKNDLEGRTGTRSIPEPTKTKPFNLTTPKLRPVPIPKIIPKLDKTRPIPKSTYEQPKDLFELEQIRDENHRHGQHKLHHVRSLDYHFMQNTKKSINKPIDPLSEENIQFKAHPAPSKPQSNQMPVKFNVAAVLKESYLYKKQEDDVRRRLNAYESGEKDGHEFEQWQQTMLKQDNEQEILAIEKKRLEGKISYEEAILARQRLIEENRQIADEIKQQTREIIAKHVKDKVQEEQRMKQLVEEIISERDNAKIAQQKLQQYKIEFVKQYKEELKQSLRQALEEAETEMRQRAELIQQIRALDLQTIERWKPFDITAEVGHGLYDEMSIAEVRERLELLKIEREKEREYRREQIVKEKQNRERMITTTVQTIAKYRNELTTQAVLKKQRNSSAPVPIQQTNVELQQMRTYLETKRAERLSKQRESLATTTTTTTDNQYQSKSSNEWNRFDQVEKASDKALKRLAPILLA